MPEQLCPCGTGEDFQSCCQPYLQGIALAPTPEALMRSRYAAFVTQNIEYLIKTHHPSQRTINEKTALQDTCRTTRWQRLEVIRSGAINGSQGFVEFMAVYKAGSTAQLHERSTFVKESGQWFYLDGEILPPIRPKRGQPCWCGSGKKFKRCHG
ncbi:MAG: YchJ family protein [Cyanobacteria bacterium P01_F01_bin.42]